MKVIGVGLRSDLFRQAFLVTPGAWVTRKDERRSAAALVVEAQASAARLAAFQVRRFSHE